MPTKHDGFRDFVLDQLSGLSDLTSRAMFGGYGLYRGNRFFGIIHKGRLYFKTDRLTAPHYRDRGMRPFKPTSTQTFKKMEWLPLFMIAPRRIPLYNEMN